MKDDLIDRLNAESQLAEDTALGRAVLAKRVSDAKYKAALARIEELETRCDLLTSLDGRKASPPWKPATRKRGASGTAVFVWSDWHVEERVDPLKVNGVNEHDLQIAEARAKRLTERSLMLLEDARQLTKIDTLVVALLGDFISGYIHPELEETNLLSPLEATAFAEDLLERALRTILKESGVKRIIVPTCVGNHGRTTLKTRIGSMVENSFEQSMYHHLARIFRHEPRITWQIGEGYHNWLDIEGHAVRFHHGDAIKYGGGVGGMAIPTNKAVAAWNRTKVAAVDFFGHLHTWLNMRKWCSNGSAIGFGAYSVFIKAEYEPPSQTFAVIDRDRAMTRALQVFCD